MVSPPISPVIAVMVSPPEPSVTVIVPMPEPPVPRGPIPPWVAVDVDDKVQSNVIVAARAGTAIEESAKHPISNADELENLDTVSLRIYTSR